MTQQSSSNSNLFIVVIVALVIAAGVLLTLWLNVRGAANTLSINATEAVEAADAALSEAQAAATEAAETAEANITSLEESGTEIAVAATEAADNAANLLDEAEGNISDLESTIGSLNVDLDAAIAEATDSAEAAANNIATLEADGAAVAAAATDAARESRSASISAQSDLLSIQAEATSAANTLQGLQDDATQAARDSRAEAIESEGNLLALQADATADAKANATAAAEMGAAADEANAEAAAFGTEVALAQAEIDSLSAAATTEAGNLQATIVAQEDQIASLQVPPTVPPPPPTLVPTAAPTEVPPISGGQAELESALTVVGLTLDDISVEANADDLFVDLTDRDDTIRTFAINEESTYSSFVLVGDITFETDAVDDYCGYTFHRSDEDNYYTAEIDREANARFFARFNAEWSQINAINTPSINTSSGSTNTVILVVQGNSFTLFVNGVEALSASDSRMSDGVVTIMGGTFQNSDVTGCLFNNVALYSISGEDGLSKDDPDSDTSDSSNSATMYNGVPAAFTEDGAYILGDPNAPITVVEFADFRCPFCLEYLPTVNEFIETEVLTGRARFEFRMFPTADNEAIAFRAMECAVPDNAPADFWRLHNTMFDITAVADSEREIAVLLAAESNMDAGALLECMQTADQYITDQAVGNSAGVRGTPAIRLRLPSGELLIIDDQFAGGGVPIDVLSQVVASEQ
jgi:protein-disulfide isomerase